jgi:hypothetical protein
MKRRQVEALGMKRYLQQRIYRLNTQALGGHMNIDNNNNHFPQKNKNNFNSSSQGNHYFSAERSQLLSEYAENEGKKAKEQDNLALKQQ